MVSTAFSPMRFRSVDKLMEQGRHGLQHRKRIGLVGPAVSDHPQIEEILVGLRQMGAELSISSQRIKPLSQIALRELVAGEARTIALAPEAGSERLRQVINKSISEQDILEAMDKVAAQGIKHLKLYFMIGLPSETDRDIEEIIDLVISCKGVLDRQQPGCRITLTVVPFVPKAGTPFQWFPVAPVRSLNQRLSLLKKRLAPRGIIIKSESPAWSHVQGILARGDACLSRVIADIEAVTLSGWRRAVEKHRLDIDFYAQRWDFGERLPWEIIESGTSPEKLKQELEKALR